MKKFFTFVAGLLIASTTVNATILWEETFDKNGSNYVEKNDKGQWPYAGGDPAKNFVFENYSTDYSAVSSYSCSVRSKKLDGASTSTPGFYFGAGKEASKCYLTLEYTSFVAEGKGNFFAFEVSTDQDGADKDLSKLTLKINDKAVEVPATAIQAKGKTATVNIALPEGAINKLHFEFDNLSAQLFISRPRIADAEQQGIEEVVLTEKAQKVMVDGVVYIVRDGKMYNALGTQVR